MFRTFAGMNLKATLESGQLFGYWQDNDRVWWVMSGENWMSLTASGAGYEIATSDERFVDDFFAEHIDWQQIDSTISTQCPILNRIISTCGGGIRILKQDKWECLISYILSQQNSIPKITSLVQALAEDYGTLTEFGYLFPNQIELSFATLTELENLRMGYRAAYVYDAVKRLGSDDLTHWEAMSSHQLLSHLQQIKGIGPKVAGCIALFSAAKYDVFPIDVWIKRIVSQIYFQGREVNNEYATKFAQDRFGKYAGIAQQYLYAYRNELLSGKFKN